MATPSKTKVEEGLHPAVAEHDPFAGSGYHSGTPEGPIVSVARSNEPKNFSPGSVTSKALEKSTIIDNPLYHPKMDDAEIEQYPYYNLKAGQGMFIPTDLGTTTDKLMLDLQKKIFSLNRRYGIPETDEDGDEILVQCSVETRIKDDRGLIALDENNKPKVGADFRQLKKLHPFMSYAVKAVAKGDLIAEGNKAPSDGALVVRIA